MRFVVNRPSSCRTIYIPGPLHPEVECEAEKTFGKILRSDGTQESRDACLEECEGILLRVGDVTMSDVLKAPKLTIICRTGTGCDMIDLKTCRSRGVVVTNVPGQNAPAVAELALTLMLVVSRRVKEVDRRLGEGETLPSISVLSNTLYGEQVGLLGMGDTAYALAQLLKPFNCQLHVWSPTSPHDRWTKEDSRFSQPIKHHRCWSLQELLGSLQILSVHCPLTPRTRDLIGETELRSLPPGSIVINTARGGIVDERALTRCLKDGHIGGAGLDVFANEPATRENLGDLTRLPNVVCLPHVGGSTEEAVRTGGRQALEIMRDFFDTGSVRNGVT